MAYEECAFNTMKRLHRNIHPTICDMGSVLSVWLSSLLFACIAVFCSKQIVLCSLWKCTAFMDVAVADC